MKKLLTLTLCVLLTLTFFTPVLASTASFKLNSNEYYIDNQKRTMDVTPVVENGRTLLPVRYIAEIIGITAENVLWNADQKIVSLIKNRTFIQFQVGSNIMKVNTVSIPMEVAPTIINGRVVLPIRYLEQALGIKVGWDEKTKTINFDYKQ